MLSSFLIKLAMLAVTMGVVCWIGWTVPRSYHDDSAADRGAAMQRSEGNVLHSSVSKTADASSETPDLLKRQQTIPVSSRPAPEALDLNRATEREIESLPGIGPVLAERIVDYRQSRGAFQSIEELQHVKGIGKKTFERIRTHVRVAPAASSTGGGRKTT